MMKVTRYSVWGSRRGQGYILTPEGFSQLVTEDATVVLGLSGPVAQRFAQTAGHVVQHNGCLSGGTSDRSACERRRSCAQFSLGAHIRYSLERVA